MNRRSFLKRAAQAAVSVSAAALVGRGVDWESDDYSKFVTDYDWMADKQKLPLTVQVTVVDEVHNWMGPKLVHSDSGWVVRS